MIFIIDTTIFVQKLFNNWFLVYLGRISFSLYLIHGNILHSLSTHLVVIYAGDNPEKKLVVMIVTLISIFIFSEILTVFIDIPSVQFGNWLIELGSYKSFDFKSVFKWLLRLPLNFFLFIYIRSCTILTNFQYFLSNPFILIYRFFSRLSNKENRKVESGKLDSENLVIINVDSQTLV
jgi:hypothetical protein